MLLTMELVIATCCRAPRILQTEIDAVDNVQPPELWRSEINAFDNRTCNRNGLSSLQSPGCPRSILFPCLSLFISFFISPGMLLNGAHAAACDVHELRTGGGSGRFRMTPRQRPEAFPNTRRPWLETFQNHAQAVTTGCSRNVPGRWPETSLNRVQAVARDVPEIRQNSAQEVAQDGPGYRPRSCQTCSRLALRRSLNKLPNTSQAVARNAPEWRPSRGQ